jgi:hypothetical protein
MKASFLSSITHSILYLPLPLVSQRNSSNNKMCISMPFSLMELKCLLLSTGDIIPLALTGFLLWPYVYGHFWGTFFTGAYFPQKSDLSPRIESKYKPFQKHVSSYILKRSPDSVVWSAPTLLRAALDLFNEDNSLRGENTVADSNPARVLS